MKSESINDLATALAKAQGEMHGAKKDSKNPFFKSNYADLESVWDACREPLAKNGLSIVQIVQMDPPTINLCTYLLHSSGQWIASYYPLKPIKEDPQSMGSAISYARRYSLAAMVGVYQTDDDAELALNRINAAKDDPSIRYFDELESINQEPEVGSLIKKLNSEKKDSKGHYGPHLYNPHGVCNVMTTQNKQCGEKKP